MNDKDVGIEKLLTAWQVFYKDFLGLDVDLSSVIIPPEQPGFGRLLVIIKGVTMQQVYEACKKLFPGWEYTNENLDAVVAQNDRTTKDGHYAIWVRDRIEADEELKSKSANDLLEAKISTETLLERIIHELKYSQETGKHLDVDNITLCAGSRDRDGHVPSVSWYGGPLDVSWYRPDNAHEFLRARQVVADPIGIVSA